MRPLIFLISVIAVLSAPVHAITDQERSALQRLHSEIEAITTIINEAQQAANHNDRKQISYQKIRTDLQKIQQGILDAVNAERREPRSLPPISGEYR